MKPSTTIYDVGKTKFGQRLTLEQHVGAGGHGWQLVQHQADQRDERQTIYVTELIAAAILDQLG